MRGWVEMLRNRRGVGRRKNHGRWNERTKQERARGERLKQYKQGNVGKREN